MNLDPNELRRLVKISLWFGLGIFAGLAACNVFSVASLAALKWLATVAGFVLGLWSFYFSWGWRIPLLRRVLPRPNLNGTWLGCIRSDWRDETGANPGPIRIVMVVRQTFLCMHVHTFTRQLEASSYSCNFLPIGHMPSGRLALLYVEHPPFASARPAHRGAEELRIISRPSYWLEGEYWTNRQTSGIISLRFVSRQRVETLRDAQDRWPEASAWPELPTA
jgi:hypothetical protein